MQSRREALEYMIATIKGNGPLEVGGFMPIVTFGLPTRFSIA